MLGRRVAVVGAVVLAVVLAVGGGVLVGADRIGAVPTSPYTLRVHKAVVGASTTPFRIEVECTGPENGVPTVQLPFRADGTPDTDVGASGWVANAGDWLLNSSSLPGKRCTVTETNAGAAVTVAYACTYGIVTEEVEATDDPVCESAEGGTVTFPDVCLQSVDCVAEVTVTNTMPVITVRPVVTVAGGTVTISGTGCFPGLQALGDVSAASSGGVVTGTLALSPPLTFGPVTAAADGTWSTTVVVPAGTLPGSYALDATCTLPYQASREVSAQASGPFAYVTQSLTVAVTAPPRFTG